MRPVKVTWRDTHGDAGWIAPGECDPEPRLIVSVGWLMRAEKQGHDTLCMDWDEAAGRVNGVSHIPSALVVKIEDL
jgi:hypothetical protein